MPLLPLPLYAVEIRPSDKRRRRMGERTVVQQSNLLLLLSNFFILLVPLSASKAGDESLLSHTTGE